MNEQCQFTCKTPVLRDELFEITLSPENFYQTPGFRRELDIIPTGSEWSRIIQNSKVANGCVIHSKERIYFRTKKFQIRRLFYEWFVGPLEKSQIVATTCKTPGCVYPPHMTILRSKRETIKEMVKNRVADKNLTQKQRASKYDISLGILQKVDQGKAYKDLAPINTVTSAPEEDNRELQTFHFVFPPFMLKHATPTT